MVCCVAKTTYEINDTAPTMGFKDRFGLVRTRSTVSGLDGDNTATEARDELKNFRKQHKWDPFLDNEKLDTIKSAIGSDNVEKAIAVDESIIQEDSPYEEVRSSVRC